MPDYYTGADGRDVYDITRQYDHLSYPLCNALKYLIRAGRKTADPREDLRKAMHCIEREIDWHETTIDKPILTQRECRKLMEPLEKAVGMTQAEIDTILNEGEGGENERDPTRLQRFRQQRPHRVDGD